MLRYLLEKEFKQIFRSRFLPRFIVAFPFFSLLVFPLVASFDIRNISLSVVDNDHSTFSQRLLQKVAASGYFRLVDVSPTYWQALKKVDLDSADIILEIPPSFEKTLVRERRAGLLVAANTVNGTKGGLGSVYMAGIVNDFAAELRDEWVQGPSRSAGPAIEIIPRFRYNPCLEYRVFMVPAIMVMLLTMMCGFLPALNIVSEKEKGTMEQMNVTPVRRFTFILSKLIPYWVIGFVVLTICFGVARLVYGLVPLGGVSTVYLFASVFVLGLSGFGLVISNYARNIQQAAFMIFFFVISMIFLSGLYTPVASMPGWAQNLSAFSPLKYFIMVMRQVYLKGSGLAELSRPLAALCAFALFTSTWAIISYRKRS